MKHDRLIRLREAETLAGIKRSQIYEMIAAGAFPPPAKIGGAARWSQSEICSWRDARSSERRASEASDAVGCGMKCEFLRALPRYGRCATSARMPALYGKQAD